MAFPIITQSSNEVGIETSGSIEIIMPPFSEGEYLICFFATNSDSVYVNIDQENSSSDWQQSDAYIASSLNITMFYKQANGYNDQLTVIPSSAIDFTYVLYSVSNAVNDIPSRSYTNGGGTSPSHNGVSLSNGTQDYLTFAVLIYSGEEIYNLTPPSSYTINITEQGSMGYYPTLSVATRNINTSGSVTPGNWSIPFSANWLTLTVAITPYDGMVVGVGETNKIAYV